MLPSCVETFFDSAPGGAILPSRPAGWYGCRTQRRGEIAQAATDPQQRRLWIATRRRLDQTPQVGQHVVSFLRPPPGPRTRPKAISPNGRGAEFGEAPIDRAASDAGDP